MSDLFEYHLDADNCHFKYAKGNPTLTGREFHNYDEIVLFLRGNAQLISKNIQIKLTPGSIVLIPKEHFHQFYLTDQDNYIRCVFSFKETPQLQQLIREVMTEVTLISNPSKNVTFIFENLIKTSKSNLPDSDKSLLLQASLVQLLIEQKQFCDNSINKSITVSPLTQQALAYIDSNFNKNLTLQNIAQFLNVSVSSLSHRFHDDLNISVYRYICEKRLSAARQYIEKGESLSNAAIQSGFNDYSGFFRIYKSYYGKSPSSLLKNL